MAGDGTDTDWEKCLEWIVKCGVLGENHILVKPGVKVNEFAPVLRDGVILCHLLNVLAPGAIDQREFSQRPNNSQFLCTKNIRAFLNRCRDVFMLTEDELFDVADLWLLKNVGKVLQTISYLSNSELAKSSGISGFEIIRHKDYDDLKSLANKAIAENTIHRKHDEKIYEDLFSVKRHESTRESSIKVSSMTKRECCIKELVETEKNYVSVLTMILEKFRAPLVEKLSEDNLASLFSGIEELCLTHSGFYSDLSKACHSRHGTIKSFGHMTIADCFIKWKEKLLKYGDYCSQLNKVHLLLDKLMSNSTSREAILACQKDANQGKFRLWDLLSVPMQRVLKYHLLLKELVKHTEPQHPERKSLDKALEEMQDLAGYVNETKRDSENLADIEAVQKSISNLSKLNVDLMNLGHLRQDGELKFRLGEEQRDNSRFVFLFDKSFLICKSKGAENYVLKEIFEIKKSEVLEIDVGKEKFGFHLHANNQNGMDCIVVFFTKSVELRKKWMESFEISMDNVYPEGWSSERHCFAMTSFSEPTICDVCRRLLSGVFFQGYKCNFTNMVVHKNCLNKAKSIDGPPTIPPRDSSYRARAISKYQGKPPPPYSKAFLPFQENDIITIISTDLDPWWMGRNAGQEGFFPKQFVQMTRQRGSTVTEDMEDLILTPLPTHAHIPLASQSSVFSGPALPSRTSRSSSVLNQSRTASPPVHNDFLLPSSHNEAPPLPKRSSREPSICTPSPSFVSPLPPLPVSATSTNSSFLQNEFFGEDLAVFPWFLGEMTREKATELLEKQKDGTYLVRISKTVDRRGELSLSLKFDSVKHIKIQRNTDRRWFLASCKTFTGVQELIEYYQCNSLEQCFTEAPTKLLIPLKDTLLTAA